MTWLIVVIKVILNGQVSVSLKLMVVILMMLFKVLTTRSQQE